MGSDRDVVILVEQTLLPLERRATEWDLTHLPVPADVLVYLPEEWEKVSSCLRQETTWVDRRGTTC